MSPSEVVEINKHKSDEGFKSERLLKLCEHVYGVHQCTLERIALLFRSNAWCVLVSLLKSIAAH